MRSLNGQETSMNPRQILAITTESRVGPIQIGEEPPEISIFAPVLNGVCRGQDECHGTRMG
jgi:hypothetical protein